MWNKRNDEQRVLSRLELLPASFRPHALLKLTLGIYIFPWNCPQSSFPCVSTASSYLRWCHTLSQAFLYYIVGESLFIFFRGLSSLVSILLFFHFKEANDGYISQFYFFLLDCQFHFYLSYLFYLYLLLYYLSGCKYEFWSQVLMLFS